MATSDHPPEIPPGLTHDRLRYGFVAVGVRLLPADGVLTEVVDDARLYPVPKATAALAGLMTLRGNIIPVLDFGSPGQPVSQLRQVRRRVLVFDGGESAIAMLLETMPELIALVAPETSAARPDSTLAEFLVRPWAAAQDPGQIWWEFNHRAAGASLLRSTVTNAAIEADRAIAKFAQESS